MKEEGNDQHLRARLESFSDIVFGFVVAMMATHIKVPGTPSELVLIRKDLAIFAFSFLLLCALWLRHHRMMQRYFISDAFCTIMTFVILGTVALYSYPLQLYLRFPGDPVALRSYAWGLAFLCALYAAIALYANRREGASWTPKRQREYRRALVVNGVMGLAMVIFPFVFENSLVLVLFAAIIVAFRFSRPWILAPEREIAPAPESVV